MLTLEYYWLVYLKIPVDAVDVEFASNLASLRSSRTHRKNISWNCSVLTFLSFFYVYFLLKNYGIFSIGMAYAVLHVAEVVPP